MHSIPYDKVTAKKGWIKIVLCIKFIWTFQEFEIFSTQKYASKRLET